MKKLAVSKNWWLGAAATLLCIVVMSSEAQRAGGAPGAAGPDPASLPTPRLANGKPDLTGSWRGSSGFESAGGGMFRRCSPFQASCMEWTNQSADYVFMHSSRLSMNKPLYRPEHWDAVQALDMWTNRDDPVMTCLPLGIPRQGAPSRIYMTDNDILMVYRGGIDGGGGYSEFRMVDLNKTEHTEDDQYAYSYYGRAVASWEGDTLVLDSIGFSDETWLGRGGYFHSTDMRFIERFTRTGNQMIYEATVIDPDVLAEPWVLPTRTMTISGDSIITERGSCTDTEHDQVSSQWRH